MLDIFWGWHLCRPFEILRILPQVLKSGWRLGQHFGSSSFLEIDSLICGFHFRTRLRGAEFGDGPIEKIDLIVKVHDCCKSHERYPELILIRLKIASYH